MRLVFIYKYHIYLDIQISPYIYDLLTKHALFTQQFMVVLAMTSFQNCCQPKWRGRGFLVRVLCKLKVPGWMELCMSYWPIWVQIEFEGLPMSTKGLFPQHIKPYFNSLSLRVTFRRQRPTSCLRQEANSPSFQFCS